MSADEVHDTLSSQTKGPILYFVGKNESIKEEPNTASFVNLLINLYAEGKEPKVDSSGHRLTKFVSSYFSLPGIFSKDSENKPYNILKKKPDFSNAYGSASKADGTDFEMLKNVNKGVFSVKLKAVCSLIFVFLYWIIGFNGLKGPVSAFAKWATIFDSIIMCMG